MKTPSCCKVDSRIFYSWSLLFLAAVVSFCSCEKSFSMPAQVMIIRHAEKPGEMEGADGEAIVAEKGAEKIDLSPNLSEDGVRRARMLARFFTEKSAMGQNGKISNERILDFGPPVGIFTFSPKVHHKKKGGDVNSDSKQGSLRGFQTVYFLWGTLANAHLPIYFNGEIERDQVEILKRSVLENPAFNGKSVLICWEHDAIASVVEAFGFGPLAAAKGFTTWKSKDFSHVLLMRYGANGLPLNFDIVKQDKIGKTGQPNSKK